MNMLNEGSLPRKFITNINSIRQKMPQFWAQKHLNHITLQSVNCSDGILNKFEQLAIELSENYKLIPEERYIAIASIYLFEIGIESSLLFVIQVGLIPFVFTVLY